MEIKLKKCKKCDGCRGFYQSNGYAECTASWEIESCGQIEPYGLTKYRPLGGLCYKPKTYDELLEACKLNRERSRKLN
jgi:hypothetical protein